MSQNVPSMLLDLPACLKALISDRVARSPRHIGWNIALLYAFIPIT